MSLLHDGQVRERARTRARAAGRSADEELSAVSRRQNTRYDVFLSQTIRDAEIVLGVYDVLTELGLVVFCDWIAAPEVDRSGVTPTNAKYVRRAMGASDALLFLDAEGAGQSLWMCWELGWFDGAKGRVAVLPVLPEGQEHYRGREFLGLYPYVRVDGTGKLSVVRPMMADRHGIMLIDAPNSLPFDTWRKDPARSAMRPRT